MAQSLETLRNRSITNLYGRRAGLDIDETLVGVKDVKKVITDLTSASTATAIPAHGFVNFTGTSLATSAAGGAFVLTNPIPGIEVTVCNVNANTSAASPGSTSLWLVRPSTAFVILSTEGSTMTSINLNAGAAVKLVGLTTGLMQVLSRSLAGVVVNGTT